LNQLGIDSDYVPEFKDGNTKVNKLFSYSHCIYRGITSLTAKCFFSLHAICKYVTNATKGELTGKRVSRPGRLTGGGEAVNRQTKKKRVPPADWKPRPPKEHLLPKRVITVVGPESSGTTLLATALGVAVGAFNANGEWYRIHAFGRRTKAAVDPAELDFSRDAVMKMDFKESVTRSVNSIDGVEIQHLSLPWGWICDNVTKIDVVEALVPEECFRYERAPNMDPHFAESYFWAEHSKEMRKKKLLMKKRRAVNHRLLSESDNLYFNEHDIVKMSKCRHEAMISEDQDEYTCGAKCGTGRYSGFSLYPQRFSVNITS
jgi:hypothetical protein